MLPKIYSLVAPAVSSLVWLLVLRLTSRTAFRRGFAAGLGRASELVSNGFHNPAHPIHNLYK